jgi:hypothetical protein
LDRIKGTGDIFWAESDREWILAGATVHVSMVGFDNGTETRRVLDGLVVSVINSDLTSGIDVTRARDLPENAGIAFIGSQKGGPFDIREKVARAMIVAKGNPNGRPNSDVIRPWINASDITGHSRGMWIIDFGPSMPLEQAAMYEQPFEYAKKHVYPERKNVKRKNHRTYWWRHAEARPGMRMALEGLQRYVATPRVSKHRVFTWVPSAILADSGVVVFAREDDYFFGVLHSRPHEIWARSRGTQLREAESGFRYSESLVFDSFPFPWPPGQEPKGDPRVLEIEEAARALCEQRDAWLQPADASPAELKEKTLTNLYNRMPEWLRVAHARLDAAVMNAYGWEIQLGSQDLLACLMELNGLRERRWRLERVLGL